ncbi:aspartyl/asparaginyl beta-hydroxylase domain-containing protein [Pedobacter sp. KLB.chiD]|uniref:aspartyl/asparaginyl beta-hydroxylase domain-containing protein n=1 Tax=Pedobacter sp. KLB.chiD TaxID=3387402 RepID=UPI00399B9DD0
MTRYLKFARQYDVKVLQNELLTAMESQWQDHFNRNDYRGRWQSISLQSASGKTNDISANYGVEGYRETPLLKRLPYIKSILDEWQGPKEAIRLLALHPGAEIKPHRDRGCNYLNGVCRIHIPIQTNAKVQFTVGGTELNLDAGSCWYIDFDQIHSIINNGENIRIHLVIDGIRNNWTDEYFAANGYDFEAEQKENKVDRESALQIISELERLGTPISKQLIADLKRSI